MQPKTYESFRDELVDLLQSATDLEGLNAETRDLLARVGRKTRENQFEIVLAGEFQGGKSTTFNALCDGRELSPTGSGIKTSGCILAAQNISDPSEPETARVYWKSSPELTAGFSDLLLPNLQSLAPERFDRITASEMGRILNLDDPADRRLLRAAADEEWEVWAKDRAGYDPEQKGHLDVLRAASIIARYHGDPGLNRLRGQEGFTPAHAGRMTAFPEDWEERWADQNPGRFRLEELLFIFIRDIRLRIHSRNLGRLGCVLIDCPGLFASRWDTETARRAMFNADAILYLFDGSKTLKLSDLNALQFIRNNGMRHKLLFGCNMRAHSLADSRRILSVSMTALRHHGFDIGDDGVVLYHALMALRSVQGRKLADAVPGMPGPHDAESLRKAIQRRLSILEIEEPEPDQAGLFFDFARRISGLDRLTGMMETHVLKKKARSILIDNGARVAAGCLLEAEGSLKSREENLLKKEKEFRDQAASAEMELRKFRIACISLLAHLDENGPDYALSEDIWNRLEGAQTDLTDKTCERIYDEVANKFSFSLLAKDKFKDKISGIIKSEIDNRFSEIIHAWVLEIKDGKNTVYNREVVERVRAVSKELKRIWEGSALVEMDLVTGIAVAEFSGDMELDSSAIFRELESDQAFENVRYNAILAAGGMTGIFTATSGVLVAVYILITRLFWLRIATVVAFVVNIILVFLTRGLIQKSLRQEIRRKLDPAFILLFSEIREDVKKEFQKFSKDIRDFYKKGFQAAINKPQNVFEQRKKTAEADFQKNREERAHAAAETRRIREEKIHPLRQALESFGEKVERNL
jgi:hypothetical protein